jgi:hypothetical protein
MGDSKKTCEGGVASWREQRGKNLLGLTKFQELAKDAKACYKINQLVLVNLDVLDEYLETFRITEDSFYK